MKFIGSTLFFFGIGSMVAHFFHMELLLLGWIENWGSTTAWILRAALAIGGGILWLIGKSRQG